MTADIAAKSLRKAQTAIRESGAENLALMLFPVELTHNLFKTVAYQDIVRPADTFGRNVQIKRMMLC